MPGKTIAVLGGGVGGVVTANELRKRLGREHRVVLIEKERDHVFWPSLLWLQVGMREPEKIVRPLALLEKKGIEVINEEITAIHPDRKAVNWEGGELESDYLIVSLGAQLAPEQIPGLSEAGHNLYTVAGATEIRDSRQDFTHGNLVVLVARTPFKCPAAPYEGAMLLEHDLRKRKVRDQISIGLYSPEPGPMGVTGAENSAKVRQLVESRNISYFPQHVIAEVDAKNKTLHFENGVEAAFDFLVYIPPHIAPRWLARRVLLEKAVGFRWTAILSRRNLRTSMPLAMSRAFPWRSGFPCPRLECSPIIKQSQSHRALRRILLGRDNVALSAAAESALSRSAAAKQALDGATFTTNLILPSRCINLGGTGMSRKYCLKNGG